MTMEYKDIKKNILWDTWDLQDTLRVLAESLEAGRNDEGDLIKICDALEEYLDRWEGFHRLYEEEEKRLASLK